jgi:CheY-like chemotaxis protein
MNAEDGAPTKARMILVADDEPLLLSVVGRLLVPEGFAVLTAVDGPDALEKFGTGDGIDLVLLDMTMPGLSGAQVFHELRRRRANVKVLLTSGYAEDDAVGSVGGGDGPTGFVPKPWTADALVTAVHGALER